MFLLLVLAPLQQVQAQGQLLVQVQEGRCRLAAQVVENRRWQYAGNACQVLLQALLIGIQGLLLMAELLIGLLAGVAGTLQLLLQARCLFLQGQQGVLALLIAADVVAQSARLQLQPTSALAAVLLQQHTVERVSLKVRSDGV
ncbi:hypothetical protein D3C78_993340 [compost metagenome]